MSTESEKKDGSLGDLLQIGGVIIVLGGIIVYMAENGHSVLLDHTYGIGAMHPTVDLDPNHFYGSTNDALLAEYGGIPVSKISDVNDPLQFPVVESSGGIWQDHTSISMHDFVQELYRVNSPAKDYAAQIFMEFYSRNVDPGMALAVFHREQNYGTDGGVGSQTDNMFNMKTSWNNQIDLPQNGPDADFTAPNGGGWVGGATNAAEMVQYYGQKNYEAKDPLGAVLNILTPPSENNTAAYIAGVRADMMHYSNHQGADGTPLISMGVDQLVTAGAPVVSWDSLKVSVDASARRAA